MNKKPHFNTKRIALGKDKWLLFLRTIKDELAMFLDCDIVETSTFLQGENISHASFGCTIDIIANILPKKNLQYGGVICYSKNYEENVFIDAFFLAYKNEKRVSHKKYKYLRINYDLKKGWNSPKWLHDAHGEWESYNTMRRWKS